MNTFLSAAVGRRSVASQGAVSTGSLKSGSGASGSGGAPVVATSGGNQPSNRSAPGVVPRGAGKGLVSPKSAYVQPKGAGYDSAPPPPSPLKQPGLPRRPQPRVQRDFHSTNPPGMRSSSYRMGGQGLDHELSKLI